MEKRSKAPIYYVVMDADFLTLRGRKIGVFSELKRMIAENNYPTALSPGYALNPKELHCLQLAIDLDMRVREAMSKTFAPYLPEPCSAFKVKEPDQKSFLPKISFISDGKTLENRRFFRSGADQGFFDRQAVFENTGALITTTPPRASAVENIKTFKKKLTSEQIKTANFLKFLRGKAAFQSHVHPLKWADNLNAATRYLRGPQVRVKSHIVNQILSHIFIVFDPITQILAEAKLQGKFPQTIFDQVIDRFGQDLNAAQKNIIDTQRTKLWKLGYEKDGVEKIIQCAKDSAKAVYEFLKPYR